MDPLSGTDRRFEGGERGEGGPQPGRVRPQFGHGTRGRVEALAHSLREQPVLPPARGVDGEGRGQRQMHLRGGPPQFVRLVRELPSRGEGPKGQGPAVVRLTQERLEHAECRLARVRGPDPGHGRGYAGTALPGQRPRHLQVRVDTGLDAAEDLQDVRIPVHQRGVGLFGVEEARGETGGHRDPRVTFETQGAGRARGAQPLQEHPRRLGIVEGVVHDQIGERARARASDDGVGETGRQCLPDPQEQLIAVVGWGVPLPPWAG